MAAKKPIVVSACFEAMLGQKFHTYAGGLGVVQAGLMKSAGRADWPINMYGLGILWKQGYYDQKIGPEGMIVDHITRHYDFLEDTGVRVKLEINGYENFVKVWRLKPEVFGTAPMFFLDTDIDGNDHLARCTTRRLYGGNEDTRLAQEIVLGIGGVRAFEALGISVDLWHGHEGHTTLLAIELLRRHMASGLNFKEAREATKKQFVYTTHTPELAGNEEHNADLMLRMGCFPGLSREQALMLGGDPFRPDVFNMTVAGLRLSRKANAVSKRHLETTLQMLRWVEDKCPLIAITNGVDSDWQYPEFADAQTWQAIQAAKEKYQGKLLAYIRKRTGKDFKPDVLTIVLARRFHEYKRIGLIFMDWQWLERLLWQNKLQIIVAGKPHPYDRDAINTFNDIYKKSLKVPNLVVLGGYERNQSEILKAGADLWLQTPRPPQEACGTSWISAKMSGALVMSTRDGGILESTNEKSGFYFGAAQHFPTVGERDTADLRDCQRVLEGEVIPMFYEDEQQWCQKALAAKKDAEQNFTSDRTLKDYIDQLYEMRAQRP